MNDLLSSHYNFFVSRDDGTMAFNARTGTFALISEQTRQKLVSGHIAGTDPDAESLLDLGFVHKGDELDQIIQLYQASASSDQTLSITLVPSLSCNRACDYCYQTAYKTEKSMSSQTQDAIIRYLAYRLDEGKWKHLKITWYGGEPLLSKDILISLSIKATKIAESKGVSVLPMSIVTNGVLLDEQTALTLASLGFNVAQVSFDSMIDDGDKQRGLIDADGRPSLILRNVASAQKHLQIRIRINLSKSNKHEYPEIINKLREYGLDRMSYLARVSDFEGEAKVLVDKDGRRHSDGLSSEEKAEILEKAENLRRHEFAKFEQDVLRGNIASIKRIESKLTPKTQFCKATSGNLIVIDPDGSISRCWLSAGSRSESLGNVQSYLPENSNAKNDPRWERAFPFSYKECSSCRVLPLCMGGCSHPRVFMNAQKPPCEPIKQQIEFCVDQIGRRLVVQKKTDLHEVSIA